jgi:hypothetical protein
MTEEYKVTSLADFHKQVEKIKADHLQKQSWGPRVLNAAGWAALNQLIDATHQWATAEHLLTKYIPLPLTNGNNEYQLLIWFLAIPGECVARDNAPMDWRERQTLKLHGNMSLPGSVMVVEHYDVAADLAWLLNQARGQRAELHGLFSELGKENDSDTGENDTPVGQVPDGSGAAG